MIVKDTMEQIGAQIIGKLRDLGITKYRIAKECGVTWTTCHAWDRGWWNPSEEKLSRLRDLYVKVMQEKKRPLFH